MITVSSPPPVAPLDRPHAAPHRERHRWACARQRAQCRSASGWPAMCPGWGEGAGTAGDGGADGVVGSGLTVRHTAGLRVCGTPPTRSRQCHSLHAGAPEARAQCRRRQGQARREAGCSGWMRARPHAGAEAPDSTGDSRPQQTVRGDPSSGHRRQEDRHVATEEAATQAGQEGPPDSGVSNKRPGIQRAARRCHRVSHEARQRSERWVEGPSAAWQVWPLLQALGTARRQCHVRART